MVLSYMTYYVTALRFSELYFTLVNISERSRVSFSLDYQNLDSKRDAN